MVFKGNMVPKRSRCITKVRLWLKFCKMSKISKGKIVYSPAVRAFGSLFGSTLCPWFSHCSCLIPVFQRISFVEYWHAEYYSFRFCNWSPCYCSQLSASIFLFVGSIDITNRSRLFSLVLMRARSLISCVYCMISCTALVFLVIEIVF